MKVVTQMCHASWQSEHVDGCHKLLGHHECDQLPASNREATMVVVSVSGRGSVLAHGRLKKVASGWLSRAGVVGGRRVP
jgi:UDP-N-acetylglucosamine transferase subunit ALG13